MKKIALLFTVLAITVMVVPPAHARVDAQFFIKNEDGKVIFMRMPDGKVIYGNALVGQNITFDASKSNSMYAIDKYYWDFNGDGRYDKITNSSVTYHIYNKAGEYNVTLLAVASSAPPSGDGDTITHRVIVVKKFIAPAAYFDVSLQKKNDSAVSFLFNATRSYDKDGYIKYYKWDFDGDGIYDYMGSNGEVTHQYHYTKNGYYIVTLEVGDYDGQHNKTVRVIKVDKFSGNLSEIKGNINIENEQGGKISATIVLNNHDEFNITFEKNYTIITSLNPSLNELHISSEGKEATFIFNGSSGINIAIGKDSIYTPSSKNKIPGFCFYLLAVSFLLLIGFKKFSKRY